MASGTRKGTSWRVRRNPWDHSYQVICSKALEGGHLLIYQGKCYEDQADAIIAAAAVSDAWAHGKDAI